MRDVVLELLKGKDKALDSMEIANELKLTSVSEVTSLLEILNSLEEIQTFNFNYAFNDEVNVVNVNNDTLKEHFLPKLKDN